MTTAILLRSNNISITSFPTINPFNLRPPLFLQTKPFSTFKTNTRPSTQPIFKLTSLFVCAATRRKSTTTTDSSISEEDVNVRRVLQFILWVAEGIYILWLFLLPYAPEIDFLDVFLYMRCRGILYGPSVQTLSILCALFAFFSNSYYHISGIIHAMNFFGSVVGIRLINAPVLHPMSEGLFNFVIGWTFMFAPLLFTDRKRDRYKGSLDILWGFQMFLTNTFLIPYMAIRLNEADDQYTSRKTSQLGSLMTNGAPVVGLIGGAACLISTLWALFGRADGNFGSLMDRWEFMVSYLGSERLAYAFIWDICLYIIFQPWLIGDNLQNVQQGKVDIVNYLRFVPVFGLVAYLLCLKLDEEL